jgi:hypothetical protein
VPATTYLVRVRPRVWLGCARGEVVAVTDARYPERWLNDRRIMRLSDPAFRLFVIANAWAVANRTDGVLHDDDLWLMATVDAACCGELAKVSLWQRDQDRWLIVDYASTQTLSAQLDALDRKRQLDRQRKARQHGRQRAESELNVTVDVTRDGARDTKDRTGQARIGVGQDVGSDDQLACRDCGGSQPRWLLDIRDGRCISCHQRIGRSA